MRWTRQEYEAYCKKRGETPMVLAAKLPAAKPEQNRGSQGEDSRLEERKGGVGYQIAIVQFRPRLLDGHDNCAGACKSLVDRITESLGFRSDDDKRLRWRYSQVQSKTLTGTLVAITERKV